MARFTGATSPRNAQNVRAIELGARTNRRAMGEEERIPRQLFSTPNCTGAHLATAYSYGGVGSIGILKCGRVACSEFVSELTVYGTKRIR